MIMRRNTFNFRRIIFCDSEETIKMYLYNSIRNKNIVKQIILQSLIRINVFPVLGTFQADVGDIITLPQREIHICIEGYRSIYHVKPT